MLLKILLNTKLLYYYWILIKQKYQKLINIGIKNVLYHDEIDMKLSMNFNNNVIRLK